MENNTSQHNSSDIDINDLFNTAFDNASSQGDLETDDNAIIKRKIIQDQQERYQTLQRENYKKVKACHPPPTYTLTQWIRDEKDRVRREAREAREEEEEKLKKKMTEVEARGTIMNKMHEEEEHPPSVLPIEETERF